MSSEIKEFLDQYVISQEDAKITLSVTAYNTTKEFYPNDVKNNEIEKSNVLLLGSQWYW